MIRDFSIIGTIIVLVIFGHIYIQNSLNKSCQEIIGELESLKSNINSENENKEYSKNKVNKMYEIWRQKADNWAIILDHQEVDAIEKSIINVKTCIEADERDSITSKIDETIFMLGLIEEKEKLNWKNMF